MKFIMETLTPVQIGSGEELHQSLDYIMRDQMPFVVDQNRCFDVLAAQGKANVSNLDDVVKQVGELYGYALPSLHDGVRCPKQIREQLKDAQWRPYVAGSSLKGAIRTALLAEYIRTNGINKKDIPDRKVKNTKAGQKISQNLFGKDPNNDWMRAWKIGDTTFTQYDLRLADVRFLNLAPNLKWRKMSGGQGSVESWQDANGVYAECLKPESCATLQIHVDDFLLNNKQAQQQLHWKNATKNIESLRTTVNQHAFYHLQREIEFYEKYQCVAALDCCQNLMKEMENEDQAIYLQVGWASGWRGMTGDWQDTVNVKIEDEMRDLYRLGKQGADVFPKTRRLAVSGGAPSLPFGWLRLWQEEDQPEMLQKIENQQVEQQYQIQQRDADIQIFYKIQQEKIDQAEKLHLRKLEEERLREQAKIEEERLREQAKIEEERLHEQAKVEEAKRQAEMTDFEREMEDSLKHSANAIGYLIKVLDSGKWSDDEFQVVAQHLKELLQAQGSWLENFSGKNKQKKKKYDRTLKVMRYLP